MLKVGTFCPPFPCIFILHICLSTNKWFRRFKLDLMPKKSGSVKAPEKMPEKPIVEDENPSSKPKKSDNEIDEIFAAKKRKMPAGKKTKKLNKDETVEPKLVKKKKEKKRSKGDTGDGLADPPARPRKRTEDGLTIYTEDELGINSTDAGNTPLCPFDCSCCF